MKASIQPASGALSLCGIAVRAEKVRALAEKLGPSQLAEKLERAVANNNTIIALNVEERQRLVDVLDDSPPSLPDLRHALIAQVKRINDTERRQRQLGHDQAMGRAYRTQ